MDTKAFFEQLNSVFSGNPQDSDPVDTYWKELQASVVGFTSPNELAVLNLAAKLMPNNEAYLEVGTFKGRSICGAVRDNSDKKFYAMENFMEFGMAGQEARDELMANLATHAASTDVTLIEGDCFRLMVEPAIIDRPVGVYFYDGEHTLISHYLALAVVEPLLADEALVLVDDATWPVVQKAHAKYLAKNPEWSIVEKWDALVPDDPRWANGLHALTFKRISPSRMSRRDEILRRYQVSIQAKLNKFAWKIGVRFPTVTKFVARLFLGRSRAIESARSDQPE